MSQGYLDMDPDERRTVSLEAEYIHLMRWVHYIETGNDDLTIVFCSRAFRRFLCDHPYAKPWNADK